MPRGCFIFPMQRYCGRLAISMKEGQGRNGKKDKGKLRVADRSHTSCWHLHRSKLVHRAARTRIAHGRSTRCCIVEVTLRKILDQNAHCIREYVTSWCRASWCRTSCPPLLNGFMCPYPFQNLKDLRVRESDGLEELVSWRDHRSRSLAIRAGSEPQHLMKSR